MMVRNNRRINIPLQRIYSVEEWSNIFRSYDHDHDDKIAIRDFIRELQDANEGNVPILAIERALREADTDGDSVITLKEFLKLVKKPEQARSRYNRFFVEYVRRTIPSREATLASRRSYRDYTDYDGEYEDQYKCWPLPLAMITMSLLEAATFLYDVFTRGYGYLDGPAATILIYNPRKRIEAWRFISYMFVHAGAAHILMNIGVQILLGLPLEMVHRWWRVLIIYIAGVIAGSLGTSVCDPQVFLAGASGGVYSLISAHLATIILNWSEMEFAFWQLVILLALCIADTGTAIYNRYILEVNNQIGYEAHLAGAIAGLLVGIYVLRNLEIRSWEIKLWWAALIIYIILMATGIIIHIAFPSYFPSQII
ncbi:hypothetical protein O3M35_009639 [Rhynocoris fuscipes]|uniref:EF-hand domain-containing protein n=1 Tax=Rhynocoris fuscipes TaxID=488301 RepID=A0AAW1D4G2_9HEMI